MYLELNGFLYTFLHLYCAVHVTITKKNGNQVNVNITAAA